MNLHRRDLLLAAGALALPAARAQSARGPYDWQAVPFGGGGFVNGFVFHPRERGLLYARTDIGGAYRFDPAARRWLPLLDHLGKADADLMGVLSLALDPADPDRVYAACGLYTGDWARGGALLASRDRGRTWTQHELGVKLGGNENGRGSGERLQVDPANPEVLLLGTTRDGLLRSASRGQRFERVAMPGRHVSLVIFDPARPGTVYAGSHDAPGLYVSRDGGLRFEREPGAPEMAPQRAAFGADGTLYISFSAGTEGSVCNPGYAQRGGVWKRAPDGRWRDITPVQGRFGWSGLDADRRVPGRLVAATIERWGEGDEVYLSTDDGASWKPLGPRSRHDTSGWPWLANYTRGVDRMGHWIADFKLDPFDGQRAVYGTGYGLWTTTALADSGPVAWDFTVAGLEETAALEVKSPSGGATLLAAMGDVGGAAWDDLSKGPRAGLFVPTSESNRSVDFAQLAPAVLARTTDNEAGGYVSTDGGARWRAFGPSPRTVKNAQGWMLPSGRIAVSARGGFMVWVPEKQGAMWSRDRGRSWQFCDGWPADRSVALEPVADRTLEGVFYVLDRAAGRVLASADGGQTFKPAVEGLGKVEGWQSAQLVCAPGTARDLWVALPDALVHLPGVEKPARTIRGVAAAWAVALGKGVAGAPYPHSVYVWGQLMVGGTPSDGLYRSDDGGTSFVRIDDDHHRYGRLLSLAADPLEHGTVYLAPHGRGVVVGRPSKA